MRARVDQELCVGTGWCVIAAPDVFELGDDERSHVIVHSLRDERALREAAQGCPRQAVILEDDQGKQIYPHNEVSG